MPRTLQQELVRFGVTNERIAKIVARAMGSESIGAAIKATDMALKIRGDYKTTLKIEGQVNHAHAQIPNEEVQARLNLLKSRAHRNKDEEAIDVIVEKASGKLLPLPTAPAKNKEKASTKKEPPPAFPPTTPPT